MVQYLEGSGLDKSLGAETLQLVKIAGAHVAAGELAYHYYTSSKLSRNLPEARYWAENGAKFGNMWGIYVLGMMTRDGLGGLAANPQKALELLTRAHEQRADIAAADLAGMYATGKLIPQDLGKARQWLQTGYNVWPNQDPRVRATVSVQLAHL
jgi:TPR repeat protein